MVSNVNRREHERFRVNPGYTAMKLRSHPDEQAFSLEGHVYDISEGGVCFELDMPIEPGTTVSLMIDLPTNSDDAGPGHAVFLTGNVVWCELDEPGASRMAVAVTRFDREGDKERLMKSLTSRRYQRAA